MVALVQNQARTGAGAQAQAVTPLKSAAADLLSLLGKGSKSDFGGNFVADFSQLIKPIDSKTIAPSQTQIQARNDAADSLDDSRVSQKLRDLSEKLQKQTDQDSNDSRVEKNKIAQDRIDAGQNLKDRQNRIDASPLDGLTREQQDQLVDDLTAVMAKILAGQDRSEGQEIAAGSDPATDAVDLSNDSSNATEDPLMDLAARVLAMILAAAQAQTQSPAQNLSAPSAPTAPNQSTESNQSTLQTIGLVPQSAALESPSPLPSATVADDLPQAQSLPEIDPSVKQFIQGHADEIRLAFAQAQQNATETPSPIAAVNEPATPLTTAAPSETTGNPSANLSPNPPPPTAAVAGAAVDARLQQAQAVLLANQAEIIAAAPEPSATQSDTQVPPVSTVAVTGSATVTAALTVAPTSDSHSLHSNPDAVEPTVAPIAATAVTAESRADNRGGGGDLGGRTGGESQITLTTPITTGATAVGNDFASLVANSNFLTSGSSAAVTQSAIIATVNPAGLQPLAEQIARPLFQAAVASLETMTVQIHPASLGLVRINLSIDGDKRVKVAITVTRPETLKLLESDPQSLLQSLQDAGLITDDQSLHFDLDQSGEQNNPRSSFTSHATPALNLTALQELEEAPVITNRQPAASLVDIQI